MEALDLDLKIPEPLRADWFMALVDIQADLIYNALVVLTSPLLLLYRSYRRATATVSAAEEAVKRVPSRVKSGAAKVVRRTWSGVMAACHVAMLMVVAMIVAAVLGVWIVNLYVEKPVVMRERLFFDYTEDNPSSVFSFDKNKKPFGVPVGHKVHVSLVFWMPESDLNRRIGLFQLKVELLGLKGETIARSSQPCMLRFRSKPIRLARTFVMSVPLVTQLYEAEIVINSKPPWSKRMAYNWKWTLCVWTSMYLYVPILISFLWCFKPVVFPYIGSRTGMESQNTEIEVVEEEATGRRVREGRNKPRRRAFTTTRETYT